MEGSTLQQKFVARKLSNVWLAEWVLSFIKAWSSCLLCCSRIQFLSGKSYTYRTNRFWENWNQPVDSWFHCLFGDLFQSKFHARIKIQGVCSVNIHGGARNNRINTNTRSPTLMLIAQQISRVSGSSTGLNCKLEDIRWRTITPPWFLFLRFLFAVTVNWPKR